MENLVSEEEPQMQASPTGCKRLPEKNTNHKDKKINNE